MPAATLEPRKSARTAGGLYLLIIAAGIFAELVVRNRLVVTGDAAGTAANILASEQLYRWAFAAEVFACLCVIPLILLLYELFKIVSKRVALLAVFFSLVGTAVQSTALLGHFAPLLLLARWARTGHPGGQPAGSQLLRPSASKRRVRGGACVLRRHDARERVP